MGRIINRQDIKKGDKIVIRRTVEVGSDLDSDGDFKTPEGYWVEVSECNTDDGYEIELLERPNPELPEGLGHVIKVYDNDGKEGIWITQEGGYIASARNVRVTRDYFLEDFIKPVGYSFEVIA